MAAQTSSAIQLNNQYGTEADYQNAVKELVEALPPGSTSTEEAILEAHGKSFGDKKACEYSGLPAVPPHH